MPFSEPVNPRVLVTSSRIIPAWRKLEQRNYIKPRSRRAGYKHVPLRLKLYQHITMSVGVQQLLK